MQAHNQQNQRQVTISIAQNLRMENMQLRQVLADNIKRAMESTPGLETQTAVAKRSGLAQSHISKLLRCEAAATLDLVAALARAFGMQPFELLVDEEVTRRAIYEQMIIGPRGGMIQDTPRKEAAHSRRKKSGGKNESSIQ